jgi:DNA invertase Pin-like site-specific DNA recombinase
MVAGGAIDPHEVARPEILNPRGVEREHLCEVASGAKTDRTQLRRLLDQLDAGDVLTVTRLDRLARSTRDLLNTLAAITAKKAGFKSIGDTWADTTTRLRPLSVAGVHRERS